MRLNNVLVIYIKENNGTLARVRAILKKYNINYKAIERGKLRSNDFKKKDLVIVIGGDGTFLKAALFVKDKTAVLGINSNKAKKEGFFMKANKKDFEKKLKKIIKNKYKLIKLTRLQARINNKLIKDLALNEFYVGCNKPYDVFRYKIKVNNKEELQKSSGVLISTASGSGAWLKSAGGKKMDLKSKNIQFIVREPYHGTITCNYSLLKGMTKEITIIPEIKDCIIIADSTGKEYALKKIDKVKILVSNKPLNFISF